MMRSERRGDDKEQVIIYQPKDGQIKVSVRFGQETAWLSQAQLAELLQTTKQNIGKHIKNIFTDGELDRDSVVNKKLTTAADGKNYQVEFYNLDMIISLGYRVNSKVATEFRRWATERLKEYIT